MSEPYADTRSLPERLADIAAVIEGNPGELMLAAAKEIVRLREREREALDVIAAFERPDGFHGWHEKYKPVITKALAFKESVQ
jgi:hypothetical protein